MPRAIQGRGTFRRFKNELYEEYPELVSTLHSYRDARGKRRAVEWLVDEGLLDDEAAQGFLTEHPDPDVA